MQSTFASGLKVASRRQARNPLLQAQSHLIASTSRAPVQWNQSRTAWSPVDWFRKSVTPQLRQKDSEQEVQLAREKAKESGQASVFEYEDVATVEAPDGKQELLRLQKPSEHRSATATFKISHRKLNKLARQIAHKPIDSAILQMVFSEKRASRRVKSMLAQAKSCAVARGMDLGRLVVSEAWVNKGPGGRANKVLELKGRGKMGVQTRYKAKMVVMLREGLTFEERRQRDREVRLKRVVSSGLNREDVPLRNSSSQWAW